MPYTVPDNFFDDLEASIIERTVSDKSIKASASSSSRSGRSVLWLTVIGSAAAVACILVLSLQYFTVHSVDDKSLAQTEELQAFDKLSVEDQEYLLDVYEDDVFMDNANN